MKRCVVVSPKCHNDRKGKRQPALHPNNHGAAAGPKLRPTHPWSRSRTSLHHPFDAAPGSQP